MPELPNEPKFIFPLYLIMSYWTGRSIALRVKQLTETVPDILTRIVARKREELEAIRPVRARLEKDAEARLADKRSFPSALRSHRPAIIAEIKKASPSRGLLSTNFQPAATARIYEQGGAAALSVLTDRDFFQGTLDDLAAARAAVALPAIRKDFTISPLHVIEAAAHDADAILLIAAILTARDLRDFRELAEHYGMAALVEVHDAEELRLALDSGARIVGVNNRNLRTFEVKLETSLDLAPLMPADILKVAESGIHSSADVHRLMDAGYAAFLVGEHLMKSGDPAEALRRLCS
jgi:indole-3-glycerol phosphate synthase